MKVRSRMCCKLHTSCAVSKSVLTKDPSNLRSELTEYHYNKQNIYIYIYIILNQSHKQFVRRRHKLLAMIYKLIKNIKSLGLQCVNICQPETRKFLSIGDQFLPGLEHTPQFGNAQSAPFTNIAGALG